MRRIYQEVQALVKGKVGKDTPVINMSLNELHVTISNDEIAPEGALTLSWRELTEALAQDKREFKPFDISLVGPHVMPSGVVVMEYTTAAPEFLQLRKAALARHKVRQLPEGHRSFVPDIMHSTVTVIRDPQIPQQVLQGLKQELDDYRSKLQPVHIRVNTITATHFREEDRRFVESQDMGLSVTDESRGDLQKTFSALLKDLDKEVLSDSAMSDDLRFSLRMSDLKAARFAEVAMIKFWQRKGNVDKIITMLDHWDGRIRENAKEAIEKVAIDSEKQPQELERVCEIYIKTSGRDYSTEVRSWAIQNLKRFTPSPHILKAIADYESEMNMRSEVRKRLKSRGVVGFEEEAYLYALEGYDFKVVDYPQEIGWSPTGRVIQHPSVFDIYAPIDEEELTVIPEHRGIERGAKLSDQAMLKVPAEQLAENGGIDIRAIDVNKAGAAKIKFDNAALQEAFSGGFDGFTPVFIKMTPVNDPLMVLGVVPLA